MMNPRLKSALISISLITLIIITGILIPRGLSVYFQVKGGQQIRYILREEEAFNEFACEQLPTLSRTENEQIQNAVSNLNRASRLSKENSQSYYYLAKAKCLQGEIEEAIIAYDKFLDLRPDNPLGHLENGLAIYKYCSIKIDQRINADIYDQSGELCQSNNIDELISTELSKAGIDTDRLIQAGTQSFADREYSQTSLWYGLAEKTKPNLDARVSFLWGISEFLIGRELLGEYRIPIHQIRSQTVIEAETMYWIDPTQMVGKVLSETPASDPDVGVLWTNGTAVALIEILEKGEYEIKLRVKESPPSPINYQIELDLDYLEGFSSTSDDSSWEEVIVKTALNEGPHVIGISFLNDAIVGDLDRNLIFDWIQISPSPG